jgi:hypothetical protein
MPLLFCMPGLAATVYKSVDEKGVITYSDTKPPPDILVETLEFDDTATVPDAREQQRLEAMRETTDRMVADRMAREKHRAELRRANAETRAITTPDYSDYEETTAIYTGYYDTAVRRTWRHHHRPAHPIARPPLLPPRGDKLPPGVRPLPGNDYPASLIRKGYSPAVRRALR